MSVLNGGLPRRKSIASNGNGSRIIAPNGSVLSKYSASKPASVISTNKSDSGNNVSPKSGSIISKTQSETIPRKSNKGGSIASGVSSQVARRKKKRDAEATALATRSMSASSLGRRSSANPYGQLNKYQKSQSLISLKIAEEIQILRLDERNKILDAIRKFKQIQKREDRRKQKLVTKINELKATRPPFPIVNPKICYICFSQFWPIISTKIRCCNCNTIVCKACFQECRVGNLCSHCKLELLYTAQLASIFTKGIEEENDLDEGPDLMMVERMIVQTSESEARKNSISEIYDAANNKSISGHSQNPYDDVRDQTDAVSVKSKSGTSIFSGAFWNKKKKKDSSNPGQRHDYDNVSNGSMALSQRGDDRNEYDHADNGSWGIQPGQRGDGTHIDPNGDIYYDTERPMSNGSRVGSNRSFGRENVHIEEDQKSIVSMALSHTRDDDLEEENALIRYGDIMIGLSYNYNKLEFCVIVKKCRDLHPVLKKERISNPFVQVVLLPEIEGEPVRKTKVKSSTLNPIFNEQCKFKNIPYDELVARTVMVTVIHREIAGRNIFLGQSLIELCTHSFEDATAKWLPLEERSPVTIPPSLSKYYGDIRISLKYTHQSDKTIMKDKNVDRASNDSYYSASGSLKIWVDRANNLFSAKYNKLPDTYASCSLIASDPEKEASENKKRGSTRKKETKQKTPVIQKSLNPVWNEVLTFPNISREELEKKGLQVTVWDKKSGLLKDTLMGGVSMNVHRKSKSINRAEQNVWNEMMKRPERWIEAVLVLRTDI